MVPVFVVNRLLAPYLNQAMLMLGRGVTAAQIERAALGFGMPMSPLELSDWIGTRTMFDAGRAYWQAFPSRFEPSPILPAMVKAKRFGRASGAGFYDYQGGERSPELSPMTQQICDRYQRNETTVTDQEAMFLLAIPMWIEAALTCQAGVVQECGQIDLAMSGGLGYRPSGSFLTFFHSLGSEQIANAIDAWCSDFRSMMAPAQLQAALRQLDPIATIERFAGATGACQA